MFAFTPKLVGICDFWYPTFSRKSILRNKYFENQFSESTVYSTTFSSNILILFIIAQIFGAKMAISVPILGGYLKHKEFSCLKHK